MSEINESTRIINLTEASEMDAGMNFVTDSSNGTRKVPITKLIDANLEDEYAAAPAKAVGDLKEDFETLESEVSTLSDAVTLSAYNNDKVPYLFRASGGGKYIGGIEKDTIVGGTVAWNQLEQFNRVSGSQSGVTYTNNNDGTFTLNGTATENNAIFPSNTGTSTPVINGHKYLAISNISNPSTSSIAIGVYVGASLKLMTGTSHLIYVPTSESGNIQIGFRVASGMSFSNMKVTGGLTDLTQLFGTTIADHIYSLEQATAGSGVAKLKSWGFFTEDYYEYDAGSLKSVEGLEAHVMRDADENIIGNYALDSDLTLRGIPKLDSSNQLYYDGDIYKADGSVTRKYAVVDLGSLTWGFSTTSDGAKVYYANGIQNLVKKVASHNDVPNFVTVKYPSFAWNSRLSVTKGISAIASGQIYIIDSNYQSESQLSDFVASLSGVYLVYELATPTTETADPYQTPQIVDKYGTEEYVTTGIVPVGHDTDYYLDADSVLTPPSTAGTYSLKVTVASDGSKNYSWVSD